LKGDLHEKVAREAFRLAGHKLPGMFLICISICPDIIHPNYLSLGLWEFVKKDDPPVVGITKLGNGVTLESLKRARRNPPLGTNELENPPKTTTSSPTSSQ
jgi:hypothetical protein